MEVEKATFTPVVFRTTIEYKAIVKEKLLNSHLSSVKETKKKDKARQSSSGGSAPGTPVPGERGNISGGSALTPGELKVIDCSYGDLFSIFWVL